MSKLTKSKLATLALAGLTTFASGSVLAGMTVDSNGGLEVFELDDTDYWFKLGGRVHLQTAWLEGGEHDRSKFPSGSMVRAARVTLKGGVGNAWVYKLDLDYIDSALARPLGFNNGVPAVPGNPLAPVLPAANPPGTVAVFNNTQVAFGEVFVGYNGCKNFWIALGQISIPFGLESWASFNDATFMENSMPSRAFDAPGYGLGAYVEWHSEMFTAAGAIYHPQAGTIQYGDVLSLNPGVTAPNGPLGSDPGSDPLGYAVRLTFSPIHDEHNVLHLGVAGKYQNLHDNANVFNFFSGIDVQSRQTPVLFTNIPLNSANDYMTLGFEAAGRWGPLMVSGEYMMAEVDRDGNLPINGDPRLPGGDLKFRGYYIMASYVITGEAKDYDFVSGTFGRVRPRTHKGAWEVAIRHSYLDFVDNTALVPNGTPALGMAGPAVLPAGVDPNAIVGSVHATTLGLNWWINDNVRLMANYSRMNFPNTVDINGLGLKAIVNW